MPDDLGVLDELAFPVPLGLVGNPFVRGIAGGAIRNAVLNHKPIPAGVMIFDDDDDLNHIEEIPLPPPLPLKEPKKKAYEALPNSYGRYSGFNVEGILGVEIEVEGAKLPNINNQFWVTKIDGSLRGEAYEYIFNGCQTLEDAKNSILSLKRSFEKKKSVLAFSFRTSVHVHVNICDLNKEELCSFLYLSHLFEEALTNYSGATRKGNRFCLRTKDAEDKIEYLKTFFTAKPFKNLPIEELKYSAINIASITQHGSLEFRTMRGTVDEAVLFPWFDVLVQIKKMATEYSVKDISERVVKEPNELVAEVFGEHLNLFQYSDLYVDLAKAYCLLIELPHIKIGL